MQASEKVRSARKDMQLKRLKEKEASELVDSPDAVNAYANYYENQPFQVVRAAKLEEVQTARGALADAIETLAVAEITGEGLAAAQEAQAIAALVVEKLSAPPTGPAATLTAA